MTTMTMTTRGVGLSQSLQPRRSENFVGSESSTVSRFTRIDEMPAKRNDPRRICVCHRSASQAGMPAVTARPADPAAEGRRRRVVQVPELPGDCHNASERVVKHSAAVAKALHESRLATMPAHAPLIELCRTLAAQMDAAGAEPSTRLTAASAHPSPEPSTPPTPGSSSPCGRQCGSCTTAPLPASRSPRPSDRHRPCRPVRCRRCLTPSPPRPRPSRLPRPSDEPAQPYARRSTSARPRAKRRWPKPGTTSPAPKRPPQPGRRPPDDAQPPPWAGASAPMPARPGRSVDRGA